MCQHVYYVCFCSVGLPHDQPTLQDRNRFMFVPLFQTYNYDLVPGQHLGKVHQLRHWPFTVQVRCMMKQYPDTGGYII